MVSHGYAAAVPSRLHHLPDAVCAKRLERLKEIEAGARDSDIRLSTDYGHRQGQPDYYEDYGYHFPIRRDQDKKSIEAASLEN